MTSNDVDTSPDSTNAADAEGQIVETDTTRPGAEPQELGAAADNGAAESAEHPPPDDQTKTAFRRITAKIRGAVPPKRWSAFIAAATATAGVATGWVIRRGRRRKLPWLRGSR